VPLKPAATGTATNKPANNIAAEFIKVNLRHIFKVL
jgi:hypothetical protein